MIEMGKVYVAIDKAGRIIGIYSIKAMAKAVSDTVEEWEVTDG